MHIYILVVPLWCDLGCCSWTVVVIKGFLKVMVNLSSKIKSLSRMWSFYNNQVFWLLAKIPKKGGLAQDISNLCVPVQIHKQIVQQDTCLWLNLMKLISLLGQGWKTHCMSYCFLSIFVNLTKKTIAIGQAFPVTIQGPTPRVQVLWNSRSLMFMLRLKTLLEWESVRSPL